MQPQSFHVPSSGRGSHSNRIEEVYRKCRLCTAYFRSVWFMESHYQIPVAYATIHIHSYARSSTSPHPPPASISLNTPKPFIVNIRQNDSTRIHDNLYDAQTTDMHKDLLRFPVSRFSGSLQYEKLVGFDRASRPCAARTGLFRLNNT